MARTLDDMLLKRHVPNVSEHLSAHIIAAAVRRDQVPAKQGFVFSFLNDLKDVFAMPSPSYALAAALVLGVFVGAFADSSYLLSYLPNVTPSELSMFLEVDDRFVASEFLSREGSL